MTIEPLIAVLARDGQPSTVKECTEVLLFSRGGEGWQVREEFPWRLAAGEDPLETRDRVRSLILELYDCRIVVAARLNGLAYHVFDRMGFQIFEAEELGESLLDSVYADVQAAADEAGAERAPAGPAPCDDQGRYCLDLIDLQRRHPEISSKRALGEFLKNNRGFYELKVLCTHVPPWLETRLPGLRLDWRTEKLEDGRLSVTIFHRTCKE